MGMEGGADRQCVCAMCVKGRDRGVAGWRERRKFATKEDRQEAQPRRVGRPLGVEGGSVGWYLPLW